ncbi:GYDIA family GHMP kinase [uncultured Algibacter sp.]|uniref:GYDIA family GHMP kinase n=1 Tax=uncultured Algibacter sp. TaxID=298659 RepID=UPI0026108670|nr:GYDIA family GHMP kinase [uncultured Algibacter sp.]
MNKTFYSNGKLLISGEYVVLDGALSLAIPTKYGQSLTIESIDENKLYWESMNHNGTTWFQCEFEIKNHSVESFDTNETSQRLVQILNTVKTLNPMFLEGEKGYKITTTLDFPTNWGLGTSSTLINNIAQWANIDPYKLLKKTFGGSGYDIACAQNDTPIIYQIRNNAVVVHAVNFNPIFKNHLYFVHLNKKQNSRDGIKRYKLNKKNIESLIEMISKLTSKMIKSKTIEDFQGLITQHESIISEITNQTTVRNLYFEDFEGSVKSLGAWGGDFVLAVSKTNPTNYFVKKGFKTVVPYMDMVR